MFGSNGAIEDVREELDNIFKTPESKYPELIDLRDEKAPNPALFDAMNSNAPHTDHDTIRVATEATIDLAEYGEKPDSYYDAFVRRAGVALRDARQASLLRK